MARTRRDWRLRGRRISGLASTLLTGSVFRALCTLESVIYVLYNTVSDHDCKSISVLELSAKPSSGTSNQFWNSKCPSSTACESRSSNLQLNSRFDSTSATCMHAAPTASTFRPLSLFTERLLGNLARQTRTALCVTVDEAEKL
jgi:hypothetical protein